MSNPSIGALWRYHIKGFTPESRRSLRLTHDARIEGDRVWSVRSPRGSIPQQRDGLDYWPKGDGLCLRDLPSLAALDLRHEGEAVQIAFPCGRREEYRLHDAAGAQQFLPDVAEFLAAGPDAERLAKLQPLQLVGDGRTAAFQDRPRGFVTAHNRASIDALSHAIGAEVDETRLRSNVAIEGWPAWHEEELIGETICLGGIEFTVHAPIVRCLAVNANPHTGERDLRVLQRLSELRGRPEFGILLLPTGGQAGATLAVTSHAPTTGGAPESHQR